MYQAYLHAPLSKGHLASIMKTTLEQMRLSNPNHPEQEEIDNEYLDTVFEDFFSIV